MATSGSRTRRSARAAPRRGAGRGGRGTCPRCGGRMASKIPIWAIVLAVVLFPIGLLFLMVRVPRCPRCG